MTGVSSRLSYAAEGGRRSICSYDVNDEDGEEDSLDPFTPFAAPLPWMATEAKNMAAVLRVYKISDSLLRWEQREALHSFRLKLANCWFGTTFFCNAQKLAVRYLLRGSQGTILMWCPRKFLGLLFFFFIDFWTFSVLSSLFFGYPPPNAEPTADVVCWRSPAWDPTKAQWSSCLIVTLWRD